MPPIPGKDCGACAMCCQALEIEEFSKEPGVDCAHCTKQGCKIYLERPQVCRDFECEWKTERALGAMFRPDRIGTILMEDPDSDEYRAVCDPRAPMAWRNPLVFKHLVATAKIGRLVVAKAGLKTWRIFESGEWGPWV